MAFLEPNTFCSANEYRRGLNQRVDESGLRLGDLYMVFLKLENGKYEASKNAARTQGIEQKASFMVVNFAFLDDKLEPIIEASEPVVNGLMQRVRGIVINPVNGKEKHKIVQAYFKDYFDDQFGGELQKSSELSLIS